MLLPDVIDVALTVALERSTEELTNASMKPVFGHLTVSPLIVLRLHTQLHAYYTAAMPQYSHH